MPPRCSAAGMSHHGVKPAGTHLRQGKRGEEQERRWDPTWCSQLLSPSPPCSCKASAAGEHPGNVECYLFSRRKFDSFPSCAQEKSTSFPSDGAPPDDTETAFETSCDRTRSTLRFKRVRWPQDAVRTNARGFCMETTPFLLEQKILCSIIAWFWCIASERRNKQTTSPRWDPKAHMSRLSQGKMPKLSMWCFSSLLVCVSWVWFQGL